MTAAITLEGVVVVQQHEPGPLGGGGDDQVVDDPRSGPTTCALHLDRPVEHGVVDGHAREHRPFDRLTS